MPGFGRKSRLMKRHLKVPTIFIGPAAETQPPSRCRGEGPPYIKVGTSILYPSDGSKAWLKSLVVMPPRQAAKRTR
jgi:hypothetical protein